MSTYATVLISISAAIILLLGLAHLLYTFRGIVVAAVCYVIALLLNWA